MPDVLTALFEDTIPRANAAYVIGVLPDAMTRLVHQRCAEVRHIESTAHRANAAPRAVVVLAAESGSLTAAGGTWQELLQTASDLTERGGTLIVLVHGRGGFASLFGQHAPAPASAADSPISARQLGRALRAAGHSVSTVHLLFGDPQDPRAALTQDTAADATAGSLPTRFVADALRCDVQQTSVLDPQTAVHTAAQSGGLGLLASGFIGVVGSRGRDVYAKLGAEVQWADYDSASSVWVTPTGSIPDSPTLEATLQERLAAHDTPRFRELAASIGSWVRTHRDGAAEVRFDELLLTESGFDAARVSLDPAEAGVDRPADQVLLNAWTRFLHRLGPHRDALPWPELTTDVALITQWLRMSGASPSLEVKPADIEPSPFAYDVEEALSAERRRSELLQERSDALTEALVRRDSQLSIRETTIRRLRQQVFDVNASFLHEQARAAALVAGPSYKLAHRITLMRQPKRLVRAAGNKLENTVRSVRRMR